MTTRRPGSLARRSAAALLLAAGCIAVTAGCDDAPPVTPHARSAPSLDAATRRAVVDAYLAYWREFLAVSGRPHRSFGALAQHAGDPLLSDVRTHLTDARVAEIYSTGTVAHDVVEVRGTARGVTVVDCVDLNRWVLRDMRTHEKVPRQLHDRSRQRAVYRLVPVGARWKVTQVAEAGSC